jgi:hypothetical protein
LPSLRDHVVAIVEAVIGRRLDYHALYPCSVAFQNPASLALDLIPDDMRVKGVGTSGIKLRHGLPGFTAVVPAGTRVLMGFEAGDPKRPYALLWDAGAVTTITFDGGTDEVARVGDSAGELYMDTAALAIGAPCLWYRSPRGVAGVWALVVGAAGPPAPPQVGTAVVIDEGNTKLLA